MITHLDMILPFLLLFTPAYQMQSFYFTFPEDPWTDLPDWVWAYLYTCARAPSCVCPRTFTCVPAPMEAGGWRQAVFSLILCFVLRQGLLISLQIANWLRMACQRAPGSILLFLLPSACITGMCSHVRIFSVGAGTLNQALMHVCSVLLTEPSPYPPQILAHPLYPYFGPFSG